MKRGSHHSAAVRQRMSEASKKALADPAVRQRMSEASKKALADPAVRQRMQRKRDGKGNILCSGCRAGNCMACDGGACRCVCSLELYVKRTPCRTREEHHA